MRKCSQCPTLTERFRCPACAHKHNQRQKARYAADPESHKQASRDRYHADIEQSRKRERERVRDRSEYKKAWYENNQPKVKAYSQTYYAEHSEECLRKVKAYRKLNPYLKRLHEQTRRARKRSAPGRITAEAWQKIVARQGGCCAHCNTECKLTVDHIVPLSRGGTNWPENIQGLCSTCNSRKGASTMEEFLARAA